MSSDDNLYLDSYELEKRGWTEALIANFLGEPDRWKSVSHWANYTGKRTYFLERVEEAEATYAFKVDFERSCVRRKVTHARHLEFFKAREATVGAVEQWRRQLAAKDTAGSDVVEKAAAELEDARRRGFRTPHK